MLPREKTETFSQTREQSGCPFAYWRMGGRFFASHSGPSNHIMQIMW